MKKVLLISCLISVMFIGCSDIKDDITTPQAITTHPVGIGTPGHKNFHTVSFQKNGWNVKKCQQCHASDYSGGTAKSSCVTCHTQSSGPEACNTCHGDFTKPNKIAPPTDLYGGVSDTLRGVGAHSAHLFGNSISDVVKCFECHPSETPGTEEFVHAHIGPLPAEIEFAAFSTSSLSATSYDFTVGTCSNTYCHGNFEFKKSDADPSRQFAYTDSIMMGSNFRPIWTKGSSQATCGTTCHALPPKGHTGYVAGEHKDPTWCASCHNGVIETDGTFKDKSKHINKTANVFGN